MSDDAFDQSRVSLQMCSCILKVDYWEQCVRGFLNWDANSSFRTSVFKKLKLRIGLECSQKFKRGRLWTFRPPCLRVVALNLISNEILANHFFQLVESFSFIQPKSPSMPQWTFPSAQCVIARTDVQPSCSRPGERKFIRFAFTLCS